ncbi:hypothetical protein BURKHO8Y_10469 [Burkholderia sp. 8Y]|nr:hypothetical protein BURKHO8Y_10469 [Burkholderia sp. 8Y]
MSSLFEDGGNLRRRRIQRGARFRRHHGARRRRGDDRGGQFRRAAFLSDTMTECACVAAQTRRYELANPHRRLASNPSAFITGDTRERSLPDHAEIGFLTNSLLTEIRPLSL